MAAARPRRTRAPGSWTSRTPCAGSWADEIRPAGPSNHRAPHARQFEESAVTATTTEPTTQTLDVPGATLPYDVRRNPASTEPPLFLIGSPMAAAGFVSLASHFPD